MPFNSLPSNRKKPAAIAASRYGYGAYDSLELPTVGHIVPPDNTLVGGNYIEAFVGDGDYIELPISDATSLKYYNAAGVLQWSKVVGNLNGTDWGGFALIGDTLYAGVVNSGNDFFYIHTIDVAGTSAYLGGGIDSGYNVTGTAGFNLGGNVNESTNLQVMGNGNLRWIWSESIGMRQAEINISTGAPVGTPVVDVPYSQGITSEVYYQTANHGILYAHFYNNMTLYGPLGLALKNQNTHPPDGSVWRTTALKIIHIRDYACLVHPYSATPISNYKYVLKATLDEWVEDLYQKLTGALL
jgi:hypothetical protein